ncbi:RNA-directed DNA polymerase, eukaryota [Tanacetum coccineum]
MDGSPRIIEKIIGSNGGHECSAELLSLNHYKATVPRPKKLGFGITTKHKEDVRNLLDEFFLPRADVPTRWVKNIPIKVNIFAWKLALDRLPTRANLVQRNVVTESQSCPLCDAILEDTSHLFFNCSLARDVTRLLCPWSNWESNIFIECRMARLVQYGFSASKLKLANLSPVLRPRRKSWKKTLLFGIGGFSTRMEISDLRSRLTRLSPPRCGLVNGVGKEETIYSGPKKWQLVEKNVWIVH